MTLAKPTRRATASWILYDLANTIYSMAIVSMYFPIWIVNNLGQSDSFVSIANSISMILVAVTMPLLGDLSDCKNSKMPFLFGFTILCISGTALLGFAGIFINDLSILLPIIFIIFIITNFSFHGGLVFYNALMPSISTPKTIGRVSGYGVAIGYLGSIIGLIVTGFFVEGEYWGLKIAGFDGGGSVAAFIPAAIAFAVFAAPIFFFVKEPILQETQSWNFRKSYTKVIQSIKDTKKFPGLLRFLISKLFYEAGISTVIIFMAVYTKNAMGFTSAETNQFFIMVIPSAIIGSALCGILTDHFGPKKMLLIVIALWILSLIIIPLNSNRMIFYGMGALVGVLMGSTWTSARPLLISLVPHNMLGEFFGLYALSGKLAATIGPLIWSLVTFLGNDTGVVIKYKLAVGSLSILTLIGFVLLFKVPDFHKEQKIKFLKMENL